jgi:Leucine-rich repeat (LRR) protein
MINKNKSLILRTDTQLTLRKVSSFLSITDKILQRSNMPILDNDSWIDRLIEWADKQKIDECDFPRDHEKIKNITSLSLNLYFLLKLPPEFGKLQSLQKLDVSSNLLTELPPEIGELQKLQTLDLSLNDFTELPPEICKLKSLKKLSLEKYITELPPEIGELKQLEELHIHYTEISFAFPPEMWKLHKLKKIWDVGVYEKDGHTVFIEKEANESTKEFLERIGNKHV